MGPNDLKQDPFDSSRVPLISSLKCKEMERKRRWKGRGDGKGEEMERERRWNPRGQGKTRVNGKLDETSKNRNVVRLYHNMFIT